jgi:hypothetical protein
MLDMAAKALALCIVQNIYIGLIKNFSRAIGQLKTPPSHCENHQSIELSPDAIPVKFWCLATMLVVFA